jgi:hypothetical protein
MNFDFSIESSINKIQNINTKVYFKEVYQTFVNGNYRSSVVMLYSVLICDLVYKLRDLRDIYGDTKAKKILDEIESLQAKNPNSPEWESKLIDFIKDRTSLLDSSDIVAIESLQKLRHLSAHPVLTNSDLLFSPNKDTVQAAIRNILEGVLTNPPYFSNRIFDTMLADLSEVRDKITEDENLEKYVKSRYINRLKEIDFRKLFRSLWKVVFITDDTESIQGRKINFKVLKIFIFHDKQNCYDLVRNETHYYSNINKDEHVSRIIKLLALFPDFYNLFENSLLLLIKSKIDAEDEFKFIGWFVNPSLKEHILTLDPTKISNISDTTFNFMYALCNQNNCIKELLDFAIEYFGSSHSFDATINRYDNVLKQIKDELTLNQVNRLLVISNSNTQVYNRINMKYKLRNIAENFEGEIDKSLYPIVFPA